MSACPPEDTPPGRPATPIRWWEVALIAVAAALALGLGFANLGTPSLWHDEAVQVLVAKSVAETGRPLLPSGRPHPVAPVFNTILAAFIRLFGDGEAAVRFPAVLFGAANVILTFLVFRPLVGRATALVAAFALALSPWSVAWSREARFYTSQQTWYLAMLGATWQLAARRDPKALLGYGAAACLVYLLGIGTSLHSVLFLAPLGAYAFCMVLHERRLRSRWLVYGLAAAAVGLGTLLVYRLTLPRHDAKAIFESAGLGLRLVDPGTSPRSYYLAWLWGQLGAGFFLLALLGWVLLPFLEGKRGLFAALAFWAPIAALSLLVGYRIHRFAFFVYPAYVAAYAYAAVALVRFAATARQSWWRAGATAAILVFGARLGVSAYRLTRDSLEVASGAPITLATRHPGWREPCLYVRDHLDDDVAVLTTTFLPTLYYVGRVDNWFPSTHLFYEAWEAGVEGLATVEDLDAFMAAHPKGYFVAEWFRFWHFDLLAEEQAWVAAHMTLIEGASGGDVRVYAWGMDAAE